MSQVLFSRNVRFDEDELTERTPDSETGGEPAPTQRVLDLDLNEESEIDQEDEEETIPIQQPQVRRLSRLRRPVDYYIREKVNLTIHHEPTSFKEAVKSPEKEQWNQAMDGEMESLSANKVWELTTIPPGKGAVGSKWVYKVKTGEDGAVQRYKARLVAINDRGLTMTRPSAQLCECEH